MGFVMLVIVIGMTESSRTPVIMSMSVSAAEQEHACDIDHQAQCGDRDRLIEVDRYRPDKTRDRLGDETVKTPAAEAQSAGVSKCGQ